MAQDYGEFIEKFKPKKTSDDCYTPPAIYKAVKDWAVEEYNLQGRQIVRPFYPGGDYQNFNYPDDCVVIDNPPFSILTEICRFYADRWIKYFLFAPCLTVFGDGAGWSCVVTNSQIIYENGAKVSTSFRTNLDRAHIRTAPKLRAAISEAGKTDKPRLPKYEYPDEAITPARLNRVADVDFSLDKSECHRVVALDSQRPHRKALFGGGYLISTDKAAELKAAELKAAELKAAELKAAELKASDDAIAWELSDREQAIVDTLN